MAAPIDLNIAKEAEDLTAHARAGKQGADRAGQGKTALPHLLLRGAKVQDSPNRLHHRCTPIKVL